MPKAGTSRAAVVTPNATDAALAAQFLNEGGIEVAACDSISALCALLPNSVDCVVLSEAALIAAELPALHEILQNQPTWSDIPLILVAGEGTHFSMLVERAFPNTGNITLLEQPLNPATLVSAVRVGLRARARQIEVRDLLTQRDGALRLRDEFLAMLAHELRNPLAPMRNAVYLQQKLPIDDRLFVKTRDIFDRQVTHLSRMVDDLLDVARLEHGKVQLQMERIDLNASVSAALDTCLPLTQARGHTVRTALSHTPLWINADRVRIEQLLTNLVGNAAKFTPKGGEITVTTANDGDAAVVSVRDNGVGIRPEMVESVFHLFAQEDGTLARSSGGLGIGLTIARRLAELHEGTLKAMSKGPDKGATFMARFPLMAASTVKTGAPSEQRPTTTRRRVLVVEDNVDIRESLYLILQAWGHEVTTADTGPRGLESIDRERPDVALIDIGLPGISGYEVAQAIRMKAPTSTPPIKLVAITGYGQPSDRMRALASGFDMHLLKPIDPKVLEKILAD